MRITLESKPLSEIRNRQAGDWTHNEDGSISAYSAQMGNEDYEFLVAIHETIEAYLCRKNGVTDETVTAFDAQFEDEREHGMHGPNEENGDDKRAPYWTEHTFATMVEKMIAAQLEVNWTDYSMAIAALFE
jgi:hypothetical protein